MPLSRRNNEYCKPLMHRKHLIGILQRSTMGRRRLSGVVNPGGKYHALNLPNEDERDCNTLEFRLHSGSIAYWKISSWAKFLLQLVQCSAAGFTSGNFQQPLQCLNLMVSSDVRGHLLRRALYFAKTNPERVPGKVAWLKNAIWHGNRDELNEPPVSTCRSCGDLFPLEAPFHSTSLCGTCASDPDARGNGICAPP